MSNYLTGLSQLNPTITRFNGGSTSYSLPVASTSNQTLVFINGVCQHPGTDYSISSQTLTMSSTVPAGTNVLQVMQLFETGIVNAPADNSVTGAKLDVSLVQGDVLTATGTDTLARLAKGSANQKLSMNSAANAVEWQTVAGSGWEFVSLTTASSSATVVVSFDAGYDYLTTITDLAPASDGQAFCAEVAVSGPTYRTSGYKSNASVISHGGTSAGTYSYSRYNLTHDSMGNSTDEQGCMDVTIYDPRGATDTFLIHNGFYQTSGNLPYVSFGGGMHLTAESMTDMKFYFASGNIATGFFKLYKRPNA